MDNNNTLRPAAEFTLAPLAVLLPTPLLDRTTTAEVASDFSLPDYLPEIKRLLRVTATVLPESRYLGASSGEFSGAVEYLVCYSGGDGGLWVDPPAARLYHDGSSRRRTACARP